MKRRKTDIPGRVEDIVNRLADQIWWQQYTIDNYPNWFQIWIDCYNQVLKEFHEGVDHDHATQERKAYEPATIGGGIRQM